MEKFNVCAFGMQDVESLGITGTVELALRHVDPYKRRAIHLSFDIDALDALEAPSTGTPGPYHQCHICLFKPLVEKMNTFGGENT